jgi:hypothetical protein
MNAYAPRRLWEALRSLSAAQLLCFSVLYVCSMSTLIAEISKIASPMVPLKLSFPSMTLLAALLIATVLKARGGNGQLSRPRAKLTPGYVESFAAAYCLCGTVLFVIVPFLLLSHFNSGCVHLWWLFALCLAIGALSIASNYALGAGYALALGCLLTNPFSPSLIEYLKEPGFRRTLVEFILTPNLATQFIGIASLLVIFLVMANARKIQIDIGENAEGEKWHDRLFNAIDKAISSVIPWLQDKSRPINPRDGAWSRLRYWLRSCHANPHYIIIATALIVTPLAMQPSNFNLRRAAILIAALSLISIPLWLIMFESFIKSAGASSLRPLSREEFVKDMLWTSFLTFAKGVLALGALAALVMALILLWGADAAPELSICVFAANTCLSFALWGLMSLSLPELLALGPRKRQVAASVMYLVFFILTNAADMVALGNGKTHLLLGASLSLLPLGALAARAACKRLLRADLA